MPLRSLIMVSACLALSGCVTKADEAAWGDADADGFVSTAQGGDDCDDARADVHPEATEITCDGLDDDCDAATEDVPNADGDAYTLCSDPADCDDADPGVNPDAQERCNDVDDDCDGVIDPATSIDAPVWYADADSDGYGDPESTAAGCEAPAGDVGDGTDCDDAHGDAHPGAEERCDGIDDDCDGDVDEDDATDRSEWYEDRDGDGYGTTGETRLACDQPAGFAASPDDCDDSAASTHPGADETCSAADDDCDGFTDDVTVATEWYRDADHDGYGDAGATASSCSAPSGYVATGTDCDDGDASVGEPPTWYADGDGDGFGDPTATLAACARPAGYVVEAADCDDTTAAIAPGAPEACDTVDSDCDGDADDPESVDAPTWYPDGDDDGYGDDALGEAACTAPSGYLALGGDCDDDDADIHPGAADAWYDGVDSDCAGDSDFDRDGDGYESDAYGGGDDCDDDNPTRFPGSGAWTVPGDAPTIQAAVDLACTLDTIDVAAGEYEESVDFGYKQLILTGAGSALTTITGVGHSPVVTMAGGTLEGFTITGGASRVDGGGVRVDGAAAAVLADLVILENATSGDGGGVAMIGSGEVALRGCAIIGNDAGGDGGGLSFRDERGDAAWALELSDVSLLGNGADAGAGGGALVEASGAITFVDVEIDEGYASVGNALALTGQLSWTGGGAAGNAGGAPAVDISGGAELVGVALRECSGGLSVDGDLLADDLEISGMTYASPAALSVSGHAHLTDVSLFGNTGTAALLADGGFDVTRLSVVDSVVAVDGVAVRLSGSGTASHVVVAGTADGTGLALVSGDAAEVQTVDHVSVVGSAEYGMTLTGVTDYQFDLGHVLVTDSGYGGFYSTSYRIGLRWASFSRSGWWESSSLDLSAADRDTVLPTAPAFVSYDPDGPPWSWDLHLVPGSALVDVDPDATDADGTDADIGAYGGDAADPDWYDDLDADGMPDGWEREHGLDPATDDSAGDLDGDGVANAAELEQGTAPDDIDTDDDHASDAEAEPLSPHLDADAEYQVQSTGYSLTGYCAVPDIDGDGADELAVNIRSGTSYEYLVDGLSAGTHSIYEDFSGPIVENLASACTGMAGDFDLDGDQDVVLQEVPYLVVVAGPFSGTVTLNNATNASYMTAGYTGVAGDFDADGHADIVVGAGSDSSVYAYGGAVYVYTDVASRFAAPDPIYGSDATLVIAGAAEYQWFGGTVLSGDFDGDGDGDLVASDSYRTYVFDGPLTSAGPTSSADADVSLDFDPARHTEYASSPAFGGDLDGDGADELVLRYGSGAPGLFVFSDPPDGAVLSDAGQVIADTSRDTLDGWIEGGDLDGDGLGDLFVGASGVGSMDDVLVFYGSSSLAPERTADDADRALRDGGEGSRIGTAFQVGDFDGDGRSDVAADIRDTSGYPGVELFFGASF